MTEKRHFTRIQFSATATLSTDDGLWNAQLVDISLKGALIQCLDKTTIETGENVVLKLTLSDCSTKIEMQGKIAHAEKDHVHMVCEHIDIDSASHLRRIVELNTGSSELLEREMEALILYR